MLRSDRFNAKANGHEPCDIQDLEQWQSPGKCAPASVDHTRTAAQARCDSIAIANQLSPSFMLPDGSSGERCC